MPPTTLLVGIDEAGYGPILGPLVVTAAAFEAPPELAEASLWEVLQRSVSKTRRSRRGRVPILDSKVLYRGEDGLERLEQSVLAVIGAWRGLPPTMRGLFSLVCPELLDRLREYPWYQDVDVGLPRETDLFGIRVAARLLRQNLAENSIRPAGLWAEVLPEGHYNRLVNSTQNKAVALSGLTLRLIQRAADAYPDRELRICVDKQGGREHYGSVLLRSFEDRRLKVIAETERHSAYELAGGRALWRISFSQSGESLHLPVALASMVSKYLRELLMGLFNTFWLRHAPDVTPTAGYYEDGRRFLHDIERHIERLGISREMLVRQR